MFLISVSISMFMSAMTLPRVVKVSQPASRQQPQSSRVNTTQFDVSKCRFGGQRKRLFYLFNYLFLFLFFISRGYIETAVIPTYSAVWPRHLVTEKRILLNVCIKILARV